MQPALRGTAGVLLDELLVAGVAHALGVDTGGQGQLMRRTGFTEDPATVLADVLKRRKRMETLKRCSNTNNTKEMSCLLS